MQRTFVACLIGLGLVAAFRPLVSTRIKSRSRSKVIMSSQRLPRDSWNPLQIPRLTNVQKVAESLSFMTSSPERLRYSAYHTSRTAWFLGNAVWSRLSVSNETDRGNILDRFGVIFSKVTDRSRGDAALESTDGDLAGLGTFFGSIAELYRRDLENIEKGLYRPPYDADPSHRQWNPLHVVDRMQRLVQETEAGMVRRGRDDGQGGLEMRSTTVDADLNKYPNYYLQNFHYQSDGWMSSRSAKAYEYSTETLFLGAQDAMQRQSLVPLAHFMAGREERDTHLLEVNAGTGRVHTFIKDNWPLMPTICSDLSPFYLAEARENVEYFSNWRNAQQSASQAVVPTKFLQAAAEELEGVEDGSMDVILSVYLFHELPMEVRRACAVTWLKKLKPGGIAIVTDSLQIGDRSDFGSNFFEQFPANYHEPYYMDYVSNDLVDLFESTGFRPRLHLLAHLSKVLCFEKPMDAVTPPVETSDTPAPAAPAGPEASAEPVK